jgi:hypothetical protein
MAFVIVDTVWMKAAPSADWLSFFVAMALALVVRAGLLPSVPW